MKKTIRIIVLLLSLFLISSCERKSNFDLDQLIEGVYVTFSNSDDNFDYVTGDINLIHRVDKAKAVDVRWASSNEDIISDEGKVILPEEDTEVTLTVTLFYNEEKKSRDFSFLVKGKTNFYIIIDDEIIFNGVPNTYVLEEGLEIPGFEFLYYLDVDENQYFPGDEVIGPITLTKEYNKIASLDELINDVKITFSNDSNSFDYVTNDIYLDEFYHFITVTWSSSDEDVINSLGEVMLLEDDILVTLTLTLEFLDEIVTRDFPFLVKGKKNFYIKIDEEIIFNGVPNTYKLEDGLEIPGFEFLYYLDINNNKYYPKDEITGPITLTKEYEQMVFVSNLINDAKITFSNHDDNFNYVTNDIYLDTFYEFINVDWSSSNIDVINNLGEVTLLEDDVLVTLTLTLEFLDEIATREFLFLVKGKNNFYIKIDEEIIFNGVPNTYILIDKKVFGYDLLYYTDEDNNKYYINDKVTGPITLTTNYELKTYDVSFYVNNTLYESFNVTHDEYLESFDDPIISHGEFLGWLADGISFDFNLPIQSDLRIDANILLNQYQVSFYLNEELYEQIEVEAYSYLDFLNLYEDGFDFDGWYKDSNLNDTFYFHNNQILGDINLYGSKNMVTIRDVFSYNKEGTFMLIAYVSNTYSNYTYISDIDGFSTSLSKPTKPSGLEKSDKVLVEVEMYLSGGLSYIRKGKILSVIEKTSFSLENIEYNFSITSFDYEHLARQFNFFELEVYEVDNYYIYASIVNYNTYPRVLYIKIDHSYLNLKKEDLLYLEHRRIQIENIYLHDIYYYSGYTLTFNLYNINDFDRLPFNDTEKIDEAYNYLTSVIPDNISEGNLTLPTSHDTTTISWTSNKPNIISNTGIINYENIVGLEEVVRLNYTITSGDESLSLYFDIKVIDNSKIITNTITFGNVGLKTNYDDVYYEDKNGVGFTFLDIKKQGNSFIMTTSYYSQMYVEFPNGLISFSFKYRVQSRRPLDLNININQTYPSKNYFVDQVKLNALTSNQVYTYSYDKESYTNRGIDVVLFLNDHSGGYEIEILEFTYKALK